MRKSPTTQPKSDSRQLLQLLLLLSVVILVLVAGRVSAMGEEPSPEVITCTVKVEYSEQIGEQFATGPTVEEASDRAIESACALVCVETLGEEPSGDDASTGDDGNEPPEEIKADTTVSEDDPLGIEPCIEACLDDAILIGTICVDASEQAVYVDGAFDPEAESE